MDESVAVVDIQAKIDVSSLATETLNTDIDIGESCVLEVSAWTTVSYLTSFEHALLTSDLLISKVPDEVCVIPVVISEIECSAIIEVSHSKHSIEDNVSECDFASSCNQ